MASKPRTVRRAISEVSLDRAFADYLACDRGFQGWLLNETKFAPYSRVAKLLNREQAIAKPRKKPENWWRHWWCTLDDGTESETDIFVTFEGPVAGERFALHIEDKPPHGKFTPNQYLNYKRRALCMVGNPKYMSYTEFTTILLAPQRFLESHRSEASNFECQIAYESVAKFIPLFGKAIEVVRRA